MTLDFKTSTTAPSNSAGTAVRRGSLLKNTPLYGERLYGEGFYGANLDDAISSLEGAVTAGASLATATAIANVKGQ